MVRAAAIGDILHIHVIRGTRMSLEDKVVIVTGAGRPNGIGAGIARCFASAGARIVIADLEGSPLDETAAGIPGETLALVADAASQSSMKGLAEQVIEIGRAHV